MFKNSDSHLGYYNSSQNVFYLCRNTLYKLEETYKNNQNFCTDIVAVLQKLFNLPDGLRLLLVEIGRG